MANHNPNTSGLTPFKPGESGNPKGRPPDPPGLKDALAEVLADEQDGTTLILPIFGTNFALV